MSLAHRPWLGSTLRVTASSDPTLVGREGLVIDETRNTVVIHENGAERRLAKSVIEFTFDSGSEVLTGRDLLHRPEDRVNLRGGNVHA